MHNAYTQTRKATQDLEEASKRGFSRVFNELMNKQGEGTFIIEGSENNWKMTGYT